MQFADLTLLTIQSAHYGPPLNLLTRQDLILVFVVNVLHSEHVNVLSQQHNLSLSETHSSVPT